MNQVYIAIWNTESGDRGLTGVWKKRPSNDDVEKYLRAEYPDEFDDETNTVYIYWQIIGLDLTEELTSRQVS